MNLTVKQDFWTSATNEGVYSDFNYGWCGDGTLFQRNDLPWGFSETRRVNPHSCGFVWFNKTGNGHIEIRPCAKNRAFVLCEYEQHFSEDLIPTRAPIYIPLQEAESTSSKMCVIYYIMKTCQHILMLFLNL
jgi:hypothetical protein